MLMHHFVISGDKTWVHRLAGANPRVKSNWRVNLYKHWIDWGGKHDGQDKIVCFVYKKPNEKVTGEDTYMRH